jgi:TrmH family RNA methyltransferase
MTAMLTSVKSPRVTELRKLQQRRHRVERGAFVVEGPQAVREAVQSHVLRELFATTTSLVTHADIIAQARVAGAPVVEVSDPVMAVLCETENPQGVVGVCDLVTIAVDEVVARAMRVPSPRVVILDRVADPGNAGTIIRTAAALGVQGIVLTRGSVDPHNGKCVRASAGAIFHVPIAADVEPASVYERMRISDFLIAATDADGSVTLSSDAMVPAETRPFAWVFGNEAQGVDAWWQERADYRIRIPMAGHVESLNIASAAAICMYASRVDPVE